ncbi:MAG: GNAT family N-acetyltransferase [Candidatus Lokiarchaeota archaeon]|nr:GNAT family N-acetyltransferase [Candidatus Lokiarchaeota archaeon]
MVDWKIRNFCKDDIDHFLDWRKLVARRVKTKEYFYWEYFNGPWGPADTTIADHNGMIVGQYSTLPYEVYYFGEKMKASLSFDTGTHPDYRRQGIFKTIGTYHFEEQGKKGYNFSTGFPNENFWPGGKKFNWHALCPIPLLENNLASELKTIKNTQFEIIEIERFGKEFEGFSDNYKDTIPIYLNRTIKYLNWRYVEKPSLENPRHKYNYQKYKISDKKGEIISYIVTKLYTEKNQSFLHLVDFLAPNEKQIYTTILNFLGNIARSQFINTISLFLNQYHPFSQFLKSFGFQYVDTNRVYIVRLNNDALDKDVLENEKNHFFTMGDSDVI